MSQTVPDASYINSFVVSTSAYVFLNLILCVVLAHCLKLMPVFPYNSGHTSICLTKAENWFSSKEKHLCQEEDGLRKADTDAA